MIAQSLIRYTAELHTVDRRGVGRVERHTAWSAQLAASIAYRRARSMLRAGQAVAFTTRHVEECVVR